MKNDNNILVLWTTPRSRSTAFERMMFERNDFHVFHEPFGPYYYFSDERKSQRASDILPKPEYAFNTILQNILQRSRSQTIFIKDHAYQAEEKIDDDTLKNFTNTFLVRHPKEVIPSLFDRMPDFTKDELGYEALYKIFTRCKQMDGQVPTVIDSHDLVSNPIQTIKIYCQKVGISFIEAALTWKAELPPQFVWWEGGTWLKDVAASKGFKATQKDYVTISDNDALQDAYNQSMFYYEAIISYKLVVK